VNVGYRLASQQDVQAISNVFADAANDLYRRHGLPDNPVNPTPPNPIFSFLMQKTPHAFWVAEDEGKIVGLSDSFIMNSSFSQNTGALYFIRAEDYQ
jgi:hypothetical protein